MSACSIEGSVHSGPLRRDFAVREDAVPREVLKPAGDGPDAGDRPHRRQPDVRGSDPADAGRPSARSSTSEGPARSRPRHDRRAVELARAADDEHGRAEGGDQPHLRPSGSGAYLLDGISEASRTGEAQAPRAGDRRCPTEGAVQQPALSERPEGARGKRRALHVIAIGTPSTSMADEMRNRGWFWLRGPRRRAAATTSSSIHRALRRRCPARRRAARPYLVTTAGPRR